MPLGVRESALGRLDDTTTRNLAARALRTKSMEGSFGTGRLNELYQVGFHDLSPLQDKVL